MSKSSSLRIPTSYATGWRKAATRSRIRPSITRSRSRIRPTSTSPSCSGGDNSFNHLVVQPDIQSLADIKGKTVAVDAVNTAYAFQLYEMLRQKGLNKGDYEVKPIGGTGSRLEAMTKDKTMVAAMLNPPFSIRAEKAGLKDMGTAAAALGAYQGTSAFVLRSWGAANADTLVKYLEAYIEGLRWSLDPKNKDRGRQSACRAAQATGRHRGAVLRQHKK